MLLTVLGTLSACAESAADGPVATAVPFIAMQSDFESFRTWRRWELPDIGLEHGHARGGPSHLYVNSEPTPWGQPLPVGTILLKTVERPAEWELHAMVKRGGDFNAGGAVGWEYVDLRLTDSGSPAIVWRGEGNAADPGGYGRLLDGTPIGCNDCHAQMRAADYAFSRSMFSGDPL